jgi:hypothetical protein
MNRSIMPKTQVVVLLTPSNATTLTPSDDDAQR